MKVASHGAASAHDPMKTFETIETNRLLIRRPRLSDAAAVFERYASDPDVTRYVGWPRHTDVSQTDGFLSFSDVEWTRWPAGPYLIFARDDRTLLGGTGLGFETPTTASTGYVLARDAWGVGYATEALTAMVRLAEQLGVKRLYALCHPDHYASRHVLEKCGFALKELRRRSAEFPNLQPGVAADVLSYVLSARIP